MKSLISVVKNVGTRLSVFLGQRITKLVGPARPYLSKNNLKLSLGALALITVPMVALALNDQLNASSHPSRSVNAKPEFNIEVKASSNKKAPTSASVEPESRTNSNDSGSIEIESNLSGSVEPEVRINGEHVSMPENGRLRRTISGNKNSADISIEIDSNSSGSSRSFESDVDMDIDIESETTDRGRQ